MKTGVLAGALACSLVLAMPGGAVTGGLSVAPAPSWSAYIVIVHNRTKTVCSGALVGSQWILTAAQCVAGTTTKSPCKFLRPYRPKEITVFLGRTSNTNKGTSYRVSSINLHKNSATRTDGQCVLRNDVALLHLSKLAVGTPLWIAPSAAAVTNGLNDSLYGYGLTSAKKPKSYGSLRRTKDGDWTLNSGCDLASKIGATCLNRKHARGSAGAVGDTGGPWTMMVDGSPVEALVHSGFVKAKGFAYGTGVAQASTGAWLHTKLGIPVVAPGTIVHDPVADTAWLIDPLGYRRPIPSAGIRTCLTDAGAPVVDLDAGPIQMMAARTVPATCDTGKYVLIAGTGDGGWTAPNDDITTLLTTAGYTVTESATLPADLTAFGQVWWVDTSAPTSDEQAQLIAFEHAGGGVFLTGERPCCEELNTADTSMINAMVGGGGVTAGGQGDLCSCTEAMGVNQGVVGSLVHTPFNVTTWTPSQPGGMLGVASSSVFSYYQPGDVTTRAVTAAAWNRSSLVGGGRLVVFMDVNWSEIGYRDVNWSDVAQNVAFFLSGMSALPGTPVTT